MDILFKPRKGTAKPAILVELKHNASTGKAISQINDKDYIDHLRKDEYKGTVLLVGINYSNRAEKHTCLIEKTEI